MWTIKDRNGKIRYREYIILLDGTRKLKSFTFDKDTAKNRKTAAELFRQEQLLANLVVENDVTFFEAIDIYYKLHVKTLKVSTQKLYKSKLDKIKRVAECDILLSKINTRYLKVLLEDVSTSNNAYNNYTKLVKAVIRHAYNLDYLPDKSFLDKIKYKKHTKKQDKLYFEKEEIEEIKTKLEKPYHKNLVSFLVNTGLRIGECLALTFDDVNGDLLTVNKTLDHYRNITDTKTEAGARTISLNEECLKIIKEQKIINNNNKLLIDNYKDGGFIFPKPNGEHNTYFNLKKAFVKRLGYEMQFHLFRHTHASLCLEAGIPIEFISNRLGHDGYEITKKIYIHKTQKMEQLEFEHFKKVSF